MNETTSPPKPQASTGLHPTGGLINLIVAFLAPMFLTVSGGDIAFARIAAVETVNAYRARNHTDLMAIAQIIACGLTALGSLSLSMADDLSLSMTLRLRGNAVALNRTAEQNRRTLKQSHSDAAPFAKDDALFEAEAIANVAAAQKSTAEAAEVFNLRSPAATAQPIPAKPLTVPPVTTREHQAMWALAMTDVAAEFTAGLTNLPPMERKAASRRANALSSCANQLLLGNVPPPLTPGDLAAIIQPGKLR